MERKIVFLSGPISGDPDYKAKFSEARAFYQQMGYIVLNPAILPSDLGYAEAMRICFAMIDCADIVVSLPGWADSAGASLERKHCLLIGKPVREYATDKARNIYVPEISND